MNNSTWLFGSPTEQGALAGRHSLWTRVPHLHNSDVPGKLSINQILKIKESLEEYGSQLVFLLFFVITAAVAGFFLNEAKVLLEYGRFSPN